MKQVPENPYGCTHTSYCTDMSNHPDLETELKNRGVEYTKTALPMAAFASENASIVTYNSPSTQKPVTVLVVPAVGADSWCEGYYYFPGLDHESASTRDWFAILNELRSLVK